MAERYTKVTHTSWGGKIANSAVGALIGMLLFVGSFAALWINEGRIDWSAVARDSTHVAAGAARPADGTFVSVSGALATPEQVGDAPYLRPGSYVQLRRVVEMYAWEEEEESRTRDNVGGGSTTETTYSYERVWTTSPENSRDFEFPSGHDNPEMRVKGQTVTASRASIGVYQVDPAAIELPGATRLPLRPELVTLSGGQRLADGYIFMGAGTIEQPRIGDLRISYEVVASGTPVTGFGTLRGERLEPYMHRGEVQFYRALSGTRDQAISTLRTEYVVLGWIIRLVGFLMMWIGMCLFFGPISAVLGVLPVLGKMSGFMIGAVTFGVALVLTVVTVLIAIIAHNIIALVVVLLLALGGAYAWSRTRRPLAAA